MGHTRTEHKKDPAHAKHRVFGLLSVAKRCGLSRKEALPHRGMKTGLLTSMQTHEKYAVRERGVQGGDYAFLVCATASMSSTMAIPVAETMSCGILLLVLAHNQHGTHQEHREHRNANVHIDK